MEKNCKHFNILSDLTAGDIFVEKKNIPKFPSDFLLKYSSKNTSTKKYDEKKAKELIGKNLHYGQLKLLLSELELFLMPKTEKITHVIYAGAAPGTHIYLLAKFLPKIKWLLYDPRNVFSPMLKKCKNVKTYVQYFTEVDAEKLKEKLDQKKTKIALISDIRNNNIGKAKQDKNLGKQQEIVYEDMMLQEQYYKILKPHATLFKFRLNWRAGQTTYYRGKLFYPIYGKHATTEFRLFLDGPNCRKMKYDNKKYEEQCFYFNYCIRNQTQWDKKSSNILIKYFCDKYKIKSTVFYNTLYKILFPDCKLNT